jgi:hypothetical protein
LISVSPAGILLRDRGGFETRPDVSPLDIGIQGHAGKREGVTGSFKANTGSDAKLRSTGRCHASLTHRDFGHFLAYGEGLTATRYK